MTHKQAAIEIVRHLQSHGHQALLAGGCVRDTLLGRRPKDYDVATDAKPDEVVRLFERTLKVGAKFGVVIVRRAGVQVEVATFRSESSYSDGRHPGTVAFTDAAKDAGRRDFTINGMFYDPIGDRVIDYVEGRRDLARGLVRTIGRPNERFGEDYLRMLRAIRFATRLAFSIESETFAAIVRHAKAITRISGERIAAELEAILVHPNRVAGVSLLFESGLARAIFQDLAPGHEDRALAILAQLRRRVDFALAVAAFFADEETDKAMAQCQILKLSRDRLKHIHFLLAHRARLLNESMTLAQLKRLLAQPYFWDLYELERARCKSLGGLADVRACASTLARLRRRIASLRGVDVKPKPLLNGHDLIRLGTTAGPVLGQLTEELYIAQLEGHVQTREQAQDWAQQWLERHHDPGL
jgi:tRNA nucleotidyltransferase/poly(A) polymerase